MKNHRLTIDMDEKLWVQVKVLCAQQKITMRHLIIGLLLEWVSEEKPKEVERSNPLNMKFPKKKIGKKFIKN